MLYKCDLHIHSRYAYACSKYITLDSLITQARLQGINCIGTGDILHPKWFDEIKENYDKHKDIKIVPTVEIADKYNAHHLIILRNLDERERLYKLLKPYSSDMETNGRPRIKLHSKEIAKILGKNNIYFGPAHIFSPYTGIIGVYKSLENAYGEFSKYISYFEFGLDACAYKVSYISELQPYTGIKNSDCHSVGKLGREYFCVEIQNFSVDALVGSIKDNKVKLISSIPSLARWYETDGKKGVNNLIQELLDYSNIPKQVQISKYKIKLKTIISKYLKVGEKTKKCQECYNKILSLYKNQHDLYNLKLNISNRFYNILKVYLNPIDNIIITKVGKKGEYGDFEITR
jgi:PHP family Zn ribbon phosphoesterase